MKRIETQIIDKGGEMMHGYDYYCSVKEAKQHINDCLIDRAWLNRLSENDTTFADVDCVRLLVNGVCTYDRFFA